MKYKTYTIPDEAIDNLMESLDISLEEACETYLFDHDMVKDETVENLSKKAKESRITSTIHNAKGEKKERKTKEKKVNEVKKQIIHDIFMYFTVEGDWNSDENHKIFIRNDEKYIDLVVNGREFTINLVEHRPKK